MYTYMYLSVYICIYMHICIWIMNALCKIITLKYIRAIKLNNATLDCIIRIIGLLINKRTK